jgi:DNA excision repair protein ERCC-5
VLEAYAKPSIDSSKAQLEWGKPEFALLRDFCRESFNWGRGKTDELLLPVIQIWEKAEQQTSIHDFFSVSAEQFGSDVPVAKYRSTRIQNAIAGLKFASPG